MPVFDITCLTGSKEDSCSAQWKWCPSKGEFPVYLILVLDSGIDLMYEIFLNNLIKNCYFLYYIRKVFVIYVNIKMNQNCNAIF